MNTPLPETPDIELQSLEAESPPVLSCGLARQLNRAAACAPHRLCLLCDEALSGDKPPLESAVRIALRPGMRLFDRGSQLSSIYVIRSGVVRETMPSPDGSLCTVRLLMQGSVAGLPALVDRPQPHSAYVMRGGSACRIPVSRLNELRQRDGSVVDRLFMDWMQALDDADCMMTVLGHGAARSRLARLLLMINQSSESSEPLRLRRTDVAELLAITPVSVARLLADFRREGLFEERERQLVALDRDRLIQIARSPTGRVGKLLRRATLDAPTPSSRLVLEQLDKAE
jgi:CRP-like cAMP-binding protein